MFNLNVPVSCVLKVRILSVSRCFWRTFQCHLFSEGESFWVLHVFLFENISVHMSEGESVSKLIHVQFSWGWEIPSVSRTTYFQFFWGGEILSVSRKAIFIFSEGERFWVFREKSCSLFLRVRDSECFENFHFSWGWEILWVSRTIHVFEGERYLIVSTTIPFSCFLRVRDSECFDNNSFFIFLEGERFWVYREQLILIIFPEVDSLNVWRTIYVHVSWGWEFLSVSWTISFHFTWGCDFLSVSVSENMFPEHLF